MLDPGARASSDASARGEEPTICGIAGIVDFIAPPRREEVVRMTEVVAHRGPDHQAVWLGPPAALGHRRLAIIDLAERGNQPMVSADGRYVIVFNGEIYNFRDLRAELAAEGATFRTESDTEVILGVFGRHGIPGLRRLNGMFAFAIWDTVERRITLARDRFGQKPLYFHRRTSTLTFGSEIKSILAGPDISREPDWSGVAEFAFFGNALGRRTLFSQVEKLEPGHWLTFDDQGAATGAFWRIDDVRPHDDGLKEATNRVTELLDSAVERHLVSDVPVGVFLSGGIDSSAISLLAARRGRLASYSVGFDFDPGELPRARRVARLAGADHHELSISGASLAGVVRELVHYHDQPFGDAANIPLFLLAKELRGVLKVVLQGDGGDEMFAGYRRYNVLAFSRLWSTLAKAVPALELLPAGPRVQRIRRFLRAVGDPEPARKMALLLTEDPETPSPLRLFAGDTRAQMRASDPFARYDEMERRLHHLPEVQRMLHIDCSILLPDIFCEKVDRATMAHGLEVRLPFLDNELAGYVLGLPWPYKVRRLEKKWLLRRSLRGLVPDEVLDAPKRGFGVPYGAWLRGPLRAMLEDTLTSDKARSDGIFDVAACRQAIDEHTSGAQNHGFLLYKMLTFGLWREQYG